MDNFGNIVTPNNISDNGTYNSPTLSWNLNETKTIFLMTLLQK